MSAPAPAPSAQSPSSRLPPSHDHVTPNTRTRHPILSGEQPKANVTATCASSYSARPSLSLWRDCFAITFEALCSTKCYARGKASLGAWVQGLRQALERYSDGGRALQPSTASQAKPSCATAQPSASRPPANHLYRRRLPLSPTPRARQGRTSRKTCSGHAPASGTHLIVELAGMRRRRVVAAAERRHV
jgi:hypothetical protein